MIALFRFVMPIIFLNISVSLACGQDFSGRLDSKKEIVIQPPSKNLICGEYLSYTLEWLGIPIGTITLEVKEIINIKGKECYHIIGCIFPNRIFSKVYNVEYVVDTFIDTKNFYTYRFQKRKRRNNHLSDIIIDFDQDKKEAIYQDKLSKNSISLKLLGFTHDLLSSLYHFRLMDVKKGGSYKLNILYGANYWDINVNIGKPDVLEIYRKGSFKVFKVEIRTELSKMILGERKIIVYFTIDSRRIPIKFIIPSPLGPLKGIIKSIPG